MKFLESFSSVMAPIMTGKQAPLAVDGLVQQAQRLLGVPSDLVYYDADVQTELTLLAAEYYGVLPLFSWDKYNWEAEALGQTLLVRELGLPDIDSRNPLIRSEADFDKIKWPTQNPLDAGRYPLEIQQAQVAAKYYPYQLKSIMMASSFSVACNICGGSEFIPLTIEEPEFCHAVIQKITDDIFNNLSSSSSLGNKPFNNGFSILFSLSIILVFSATLIIPFHKHIVPNNLIHKFTAFSVASKIAIFVSAIFPKQIP